MGGANVGAEGWRTKCSQWFTKSILEPYRTDINFSNDPLGRHGTGRHLISLTRNWKKRWEWEEGQEHKLTNHW